MSTASDRANGSYRILVAFDNSTHAWRPAVTGSRAGRPRHCRDDLIAFRKRRPARAVRVSGRGTRATR